MSRITRAELEEMRAAASRISGLAEQYRDEYTAMYSVIHDQLTQSWIGPDSESFVENVDSVKYRFEMMYETMISYRDFILRAVADYEDQIRMMEEAARRIDF